MPLNCICRDGHWSDGNNDLPSPRCNKKRVLLKYMTNSEKTMSQAQIFAICWVVFGVSRFLASQKKSVGHEK